jgi:hypothetical protein
VGARGPRNGLVSLYRKSPGGCSTRRLSALSPWSPTVEHAGCCRRRAERTRRRNSSPARRSGVSSTSSMAVHCENTMALSGTFLSGTWKWGFNRLLQTQKGISIRFPDNSTGFGNRVVWNPQAGAARTPWLVSSRCGTADSGASALASAPSELEMRFSSTAARTYIPPARCENHTGMDLESRRRAGRGSGLACTAGLCLRRVPNGQGKSKAQPNRVVRQLRRASGARNQGRKTMRKEPQEPREPRRDRETQGALEGSARAAPRAPPWFAWPAPPSPPRSPPWWRSSCPCRWRPLCRSRAPAAAHPRPTPPACRAWRAAAAPRAASCTTACCSSPLPSGAPLCPLRRLHSLGLRCCSPPLPAAWRPSAHPPPAMTMQIQCGFSPQLGDYNSWGTSVECAPSSKEAETTGGFASTTAYIFYGTLPKSRVLFCLA